MTEKIKQFDTWFANAKSGDTYKYFTGNLAYSIGRADGFELKKLKKYIMDKCCEWNLEDKPMKDTDNKIQFKPEIRLDAVSVALLLSAEGVQVTIPVNILAADTAVVPSSVSAGAP